jgi:hypothetical protein
MMARNTNVPFKGRIQKRKTHYLQIITFGLQRAAGPYRWANAGNHPPIIARGLIYRVRPCPRSVVPLSSANSSRRSDLPRSR